MPFVQVPRCLNTYAQVYTKDEITAYYSLKQHQTETEAEYTERLDKHINYYVDNHWKDSKNQSSLTKKQLSNQRRKRRHDMKKWLIDTLGSKKFCFIKLKERNIGKPYLINEMWEHSGKNCDIVCSFDSDMIVMDEYPDWLDRAVDVLENVPQVGLLSIDQVEHCCHLPFEWQILE